MEKTAYLSKAPTLIFEILSKSTALLLLPLLVETVGATQAVPLLTVAQFVGNLSRAGFGFPQIHWKPVALFLLGAVPFSILSALSFIQLPKDIMVRCIGATILLFVVLKYLGKLRLAPGPGLLCVSGGIVGFLSGLVGSAGPLGAAIFLSLGLPPVAYAASEAITALAMHAVKTAVYQQYIALGHEFWFLAVLMGLAMVLAKNVMNDCPERNLNATSLRFWLALPYI